MPPLPPPMLLPLPPSLLLLLLLPLLPLPLLLRWRMPPRQAHRPRLQTSASEGGVQRLTCVWTPAAGVPPPS